MMTTITKALPGERISITTNTITEPFWQARQRQAPHGTPVQ